MSVVKSLAQARSRKTSKSGLMILCHHCTIPADFSAITGGMTRLERKANHRQARRLWFLLHFENAMTRPLERRAKLCRHPRGIEGSIVTFRCPLEKALLAVAISCVSHYTKFAPSFAMKAVMKNRRAPSNLRPGSRARPLRRKPIEDCSILEQLPPTFLRQRQDETSRKAEHSRANIPKKPFPKQILWRFHHSPDAKKSQSLFII